MVHSGGTGMAKLSSPDFVVVVNFAEGGDSGECGDVDAHGKSPSALNLCRERGEGCPVAEWWLEAVGDGVVVHWYLRVDPAKPVRGRALARLKERYVASYREHLWRFKDEAEAGRAAGERRPGADPAIVSGEDAGAAPGSPRTTSPTAKR